MENEMNSEVAEVTIEEMESADILAEIVASGVKMHHKTGKTKLVATLTAIRAGEYSPEVLAPVVDDPEDSVTEITTEEANKRLTKEQKAMKLSRIVVSPNDPLMSSYPGLIFTVGSSSINQGRMIKKFVPFNNDEGWHVPQIIIDQIDSAEMQKFKTVTMPDGAKEVQPYLTKKFNVQRLPDLTQPEMQALAASQQAKGGL